MAFAVLRRALAWCPVWLEKSTPAELPRIDERRVHSMLRMSDVQIYALRIAEGTDRLDEEMFPRLLEIVEDCRRRDPAWAVWAAARARGTKRAILRGDPRSIQVAIDDIMTQGAEK
jgi:hypothetical protein